MPPSVTSQDPPYNLKQRIAETVQALGQVASGRVYNLLGGQRLDLDDYFAAVNELGKDGLLVNRGHWLTWTGPKREREQQ